MKKETKEYSKYEFTAGEFMTCMLTYIAIDALVAYLFYRSIIAFVLLLPGGLVYLKKKKKDYELVRQKEAANQFRDAILSVSASLGAGYSVENAFVEAAGDLKNLYGSRAVMVMEFRGISGRLMANENLETILMDMAERNGSPDIKDFADVFVTAKRMGGDLVSIIRRTAAHIGDKIEVRRDIDTMMSAKKMEQKVMNAVPFAIILYVSVNSPGFLDALYHNPMGIMVMSGCLAAYTGALALAEKIVSIEV